jgi:hypothetical protein
MTHEASGKLLELAAKCEAANADEQGALISEAWDLLNPSPTCAFKASIDDPARLAMLAWQKLHQEFWPKLSAKAYESAAIALVPEGMTWDLDEGPSHWILVGKQKPAGRAQVYRVGDYINSVTGELTEVSEHGFAATPALALTAACLRARAHTLSGDQ